MRAQRFYVDLEEYRRALLCRAMHAARGNVTHAARALGLQRTYMYYLLRRYGLRRMMFR